jgi:N-acetylglutamate synthase/N-acetylornithine aminotransferase
MGTFAYRLSVYLKTDADLNRKQLREISQRVVHEANRTINVDEVVDVNGSVYFDSVGAHA